jgi:hypothetical protein
MNIFLPQNLNSLWEGSWLKFLLGNYFFGAKYYNDLEFPLVDKSLFVTTYNTSYKQHINLMIEHKFDFGIFLLSDEFLSDSCEYINHPHCKFVIRNYIHPSIYQNSKVVHIGLGYKRSFNNYVFNNEFSERDLRWNFIGSVHGNSRNLALNFFNQLEGGFVHTTKHFNSDDYLSTEEYCKILNRSCYTLCPQGHVNNESFRIFESLEAGSIPVVLKNSDLHPFNPSYWHYLFPGESYFPFILAETWDEALEKVKMDFKYGLTFRRQKQCQLFWEKWKAVWKYQVHNKLSNLEI